MPWRLARGEGRVGEERLRLGGERDAVTVFEIAERLLSKPVSSEEQAPVVSIPNRKGEHAPEAFETLWAELSIREQENLGVGLRLEGVAAPLELRPELLEVVDFAVVRDGESTIVRLHRLAASVAQVDDR